MATSLLLSRVYCLHTEMKMGVRRCMVEKGRQREATSCIGGVGVAAERLEVLNISSGGGVKGTELVVSNVSIFIYIPVPLN